MGKVIVFTRVFRYEPIIEACIRSVLMQTYKDFVYYVWVSEKTLPTVEKYAKTDQRIKIVQRHEWDENQSYHVYFREMIQREHAQYLCEVDADDILQKEFIEKMKSFLETNQLDMALCNRGYFDKNGVLNIKNEMDTVVSTREELGDKLPELYLGLRTVWGTLFTTESIMNADLSYIPTGDKKVLYGGDTMLMFTIMRVCHKVGFLKDELYYYNLGGGVSNHYAESRLKEDVYLYHFVMDFLNDMNAQSPGNIIFLKRVLFNAIKDTANLIVNSDQDVEKKIRDLAVICCYPEVKDAFYVCMQLMRGYTYENSPIAWLFRERIIRGDMTETQYANLISIYKSACSKFENIAIEECFHEWIKDREGLIKLSVGTIKDSMLYLLSSLHEIPELQMAEALVLIEKIAGEEWIRKHLTDYLFVCDARYVISAILRGEKRASEMMIREMEKGNEFYKNYLLLYKDFSAYIGDSESFLNAWILECECNILHGDVETAQKDLEEIRSMGVQDVWLDELEVMINERR